MIGPFRSAAPLFVCVVIYVLIILFPVCVGVWYGVIIDQDLRLNLS